jgi:Flp pilus assembly protein TadG
MNLPTLPRTGNLPGQTRHERPRSMHALDENQAKVEKLCRPCRSNRKGVAAVEFAVVAPLFFLLVFGMIEFGRAVMVQQIITNASREGARLAVLDGSTGTEVKTAVVTYMQRAAITITADKVTVTPTEPGTAAYGEPVTVAVAIPFSQVSWLPTPWFIGSGTQLSAETVMRRETVQ